MGCPVAPVDSFTIITTTALHTPKPNKNNAGTYRCKAKSQAVAYKHSHNEPYRLTFSAASAGVRACEIFQRIVVANNTTAAKGQISEVTCMPSGNNEPC